MASKKFKALSADLDSAEGNFEMPSELLAQSPLARIDILTDWVFLIEDERKKAFGEYFVELSLVPYPETSFAESFAIFENVIDLLDTDAPEDIREICEEAYLARRLSSNELTRVT